MLNAVMKNIEVDIFIAPPRWPITAGDPVECKIKKTSESMDLQMERTSTFLPRWGARAAAVRRGFAARRIPWNIRAAKLLKRIST